MFNKLDKCLCYIRENCICLQVEEFYYMKGAIERLLQHCSKYYFRGSILPMNGKQEQVFINRAASMGTGGLRGKNLCT